MSEQPSKHSEQLDAKLTNSAEYVGLAGTLAACAVILAWYATIAALLMHALTR